MKRSEYDQLYQQSIQNPDAFWAKQAEQLHWFEKWQTVKKTNFDKPVSVEWFSGAETNISYNCVDRHLEQHSDKVAFFWEPDSPQDPSKKITYRDLYESVCRFTNILKKMGIKKGDRVTIYMPMIPETVYAMLACTRLGAIHNLVFAGFSPDSLADRILDCESDFVLTADEGLRGGKAIPLKANVDVALKRCPQVKKVLVVKRTGAPVGWNKTRDMWLHDEWTIASPVAPYENMKAEDPSFILYTSGSTNKPKGVLHTTAGYLLHATMTFKHVFNHQPEDIYWCAADVGWVTGHSYIVYGPLANAATSVMFEGLPTWPTTSRIWEVIDKYKVNILYTAPTLIRTLMKEGDAVVKKSSRQSLRLLGSVGEPINPEAWNWYHDVVGDGRCPVVDTWWQTETGGILISPLPDAWPLKPGSATLPFFGVQPCLLNDKGEELKGAAEGLLCIKDSWPGQMRTVYKDHKRFFETYFSQFPGYYFTGDGAKRDADGYYWITGRVDDVLNVSGHRMGTAEIESALVAHPSVAEAAVVGFPHDIKGQGVYAYVTLKSGETPSDELKKQLSDWVRTQIGPIAKPDAIQWAPSLPKTRSGKIMRRILRKVAENDLENVGDTSTLADPTVVEDLIRHRVNQPKS